MLSKLQTKRLGRSSLRCLILLQAWSLYVASVNDSGDFSETQWADIFALEHAVEKL